MVLSDKAKVILRRILSEVKMVIIDEISMVSRDLFYKIHPRFLETFISPTPNTFVGLSMIRLGDFLQLTSVRGKQIYALVDDHKRREGF